MKAGDWLSERILLGVAIIGGYLILGGLSFFIQMDNAQNVHDVLEVLGPVVGMIANAVFRSDKVDKANADSVSQLAAAVNTAMTLPPASEKTS